jgi:hypothetical protein
MRMSVDFGHATVSGPAGVTDSDVTMRWFVQQSLLKIAQFADAAA